MSIYTVNSQSQNIEVFEKHIDAPSYYYSIISKDSIIYEQTKGEKRIGSNNLITKSSQFALYSITKIFTSLAILKLIDQGYLELDDKASDYLTSYPFLSNITIRQLLSHQSGLNNPIPISWIHLVEEDSLFDYKKFSHETLKSKAKKKTDAGKKASYSNLNYLILGEIIENVSGLTFQNYITQNILLNNKDIKFHWEEEKAVTGYNKKGFSSWVLGLLLDKHKYTEPENEGWIPFKQSYINGSAYGGLIANSNGLNKFLMDFLSPNNKIISDSTLKNIYTTQALSNGKPTNHSIGWFTGELNGNKYIHHAGGGGGFYTELRIYPDLGIASYLLTNKSGFSDSRILDKVDPVTLKNK